MLDHVEVRTYITKVSLAAATNNSANHFVSYELDTLTALGDLASLDADLMTDDLRNMCLSLLPRCTSESAASLHRLYRAIVFKPGNFRYIR